MLVNTEELQKRVDRFSWMYEKHKGILDLEEQKAFKGVGLSKSSLDRINRSVDHFFETVPQETPAMKVGSAFHCLALEPHKFINEYVCAPEVDRRTSAGKKEYAQFEADNPRKTIISVADWEMIHLMVQSLENTPIAAEMLRPSAGEVEETMMWNDRELGTLMKGRSDFRNNEQKVIIDLKSTMDASADKLEKDLWSNDLRYHVQAAIYTDGIREILGEEDWEFRFIFVEKKPPYGVRVVSLPEEGLDVGRIQYRENIRYLLNWIEEAKEAIKNKTPAPRPYQEELLTLSPPAWLVQKVRKTRFKQSL